MNFSARYDKLSEKTFGKIRTGVWSFLSSSTLMIVDSSDDFRLALKNALQDSFQVYSVSDGLEALSMAKQLLPDIMILDLILTGMDGITLLQELQANQIHPTVMVVTRLHTAYIRECIEKLNVAFLMLKPCDPNVAARRITDLYHSSCKKEEPSFEIQELAAQLLNHLGFPPRLLGYQYVKEGIASIYLNPKIALTKELYPEIADRNHATAMTVERSIRTAIRTAWMHGNPQIWAEFFPPQTDGSIPRPSNGMFLAKMANELRTNRRSGG